MRIGFDAKRAFYNQSGLGSYSRDTISILLQHFPDEEYFLYTPGEGTIKNFSPSGNLHIRKPENFVSGTFHMLWRTLLSRQIMKDRIDIYHGLSHELPAGTGHSGLKTVVTMHDLIFIRYPQFYSFADRLIYLSKFKYSCRISDKVIAISRQTKEDLVQYLHVPREKIEVVYQGCNPRFYIKLVEEERKKIREQYRLPSTYVLCVATLENRKNQAVILEAVNKAKLDIPVVLVGKEKDYSLRLREYVSSNRMKNIFFTGPVPFENLPALYQEASLFVYPSLFEGFGIPILEALNSGVPVITSKHGCFPEAGGPGSMYVDPLDADQLGAVMQKVLGDEQLRKEMIETGYKHAAGFREDKIAANLMKVYQSVINS